MRRAPSPDDRLATFVPRCLRDERRARRLVEALTERTLALHPSWPMPLVEEEARRQAEEIMARERARGGP